jgi:hypothetical protein
VPKGNAACDRSESVNGWSRRRDSGPITPIIAIVPDTSETVALEPVSALPSQSRSRKVDAGEVSTRYSCAPRRVTVRSASMPPRWFNHWV